MFFWVYQVDPRYEITKDVRGQIKFLEELDKAEQKRHEEQEREMLMRAAKSRSKTEDPEQAKLKAKVVIDQKVGLLLMITYHSCTFTGKRDAESRNGRIASERRQSDCIASNRSSQETQTRGRYDSGIHGI